MAVSGIQHFSFCQRQWALIHIEQIWLESGHTAAGRLLHERTHDPFLTEKRKGSLVIHAVPLVSHSLGLAGEADAVEYTPAEAGIRIAGRKGFFRPCPVEYKRGQPKAADWDRLQMCAQAMCLEEMLDTTILEGALFYWQTRHRETVLLTPELRRQVSDICRQMHGLAQQGITPPVPKTLKRCAACSLRDLCLPRLNRAKRVGSYIRESFEDGDY